MDYLINKKVSIKKSTIHGWGVFALEQIDSNELIIQSPGIVINENMIRDQHLLGYAYPYNTGCMIAFGYASLINSSNQPNVCFEVDVENKIVNIKSIQTIQPGDEITLNYL